MTIAAPVLLVLAVALLAAGAFVFHKHRLLWRELFAQRERMDRLEGAQVELAKSAVLAGVGALRLAPRMPSQHGEDLALWRFFGERREGFFVEVGAHDGVTFSNTYFLEAVGWDGICVEPNPVRYRELVKNRPHSRALHAALVSAPANRVTLHVVRDEDCLSHIRDDARQRARVRVAGGPVEAVSVPAMTLDAVLDGVARPVDLISIDVEGAELEVLEGLDLVRKGPRVLLLEDNSQGADTRVREYLSAHGYAPRARLEANVFYTREAGDTFATLDGRAPLRRDLPGTARSAGR